MRNNRSLGACYIAWMGIILHGIVSSAATFPDSFVIDAADEKYNLLHSRRLESSSSNPPLSIEQFDLCLSDLKLADANANSQLDKSEYLLFLSLNSANYGYAWGDAAKQFTLSALPLELVMLFHSTACMCAYEQDSTSADFGCCMGENEHLIVYDVTGNNKTEAQVAYTRLFCSEAYYSYSVTVIPTESPVASPTTQTPTVSTIIPTEFDQGTTSPTLIMISPVMPSTASPTQEGSVKVTSPTPTTSVTMSPTLISMPTALSSSPVPDTPTTSLNPSTIITTSPASSSELPTSSSSNTLNINIEYGISSDCGMTADDVMNDNYGITIKDGLITATEVVLVNILNSTYPREEVQSVTDAPSPTMPPAANSESNPFLPPAVDDLDNMSMPETTVESDPFMPPNAEGESTNTKSLNNVRIRVDGEKLGVRDEDDPSSHRRGLALVYESHSQQMQLEKGLRSLVYYTNLNPIIITDVEDVVDDNCPDGVICMKVKSTILVTLEEGDVAGEVEAVIQDGFQKSLEDASFFSVSIILLFDLE